MNKLDEESKAHVKNVISTGRHAAHLMCNPEKVRPLDETNDEQNALWQQAEAEAKSSQPFKPLQLTNHARDRLQQLDPFMRVDASDAAQEAIRSSAATTPADAAGSIPESIPDILKGRGTESGPPVLSNASTTFQDVTQEALQGHKTVAGEAGAPAFLRRAFSLCERDDAAVDLQHLTTLQKVRACPQPSFNLAARHLLALLHSNVSDIRRRLCISWNTHRLRFIIMMSTQTHSRLKGHDKIIRAESLSKSIAF